MAVINPYGNTGIALPATSRQALTTGRVASIFLCILLMMLPALTPAAAAKEISVSPKGNIRSIKEAIQLAQPHDVIIVQPGTYLESSILIDKPLTLKGINKPVVDVQYKGEGIVVGAEQVVVEGFTIRNVEVSFVKDFAAIRIVRTKHCTIRNNQIEDSFFGIYLEKADSCLVTGNTLKGKAVNETTSGNAIHAWYSNTIRIENNHTQGHRDGIYLEFVTNSSVTGNYSTGNIRYGLHFMFSNENVYRNNRFIKNGSGVAVMYSKKIEMTGNTFSENWGAAAYGILLKDITDSKIERNTFSQNTIGIHAEGANRITARHNEFKHNGWALKVMASCEDLHFTENNFIANTFEVATNTNYQSTLNSFNKNYWSSYTGYDLDKNGIGDIPHKPVKLFSYMMETVPTSIVLIRSLFLDLLEMAEKVAPVLTPASVIDNEPSIKLNQWTP
jgi:nitrous oxidase accessory protein